MAQTYEMSSATVKSGSAAVPTATVRLMINGQEFHGAEPGNGPVDPTYNAILKPTGRTPKLFRFDISAIPAGTDALGKGTVYLEEDGRTAIG